jgi:hypothetical protein
VAALSGSEDGRFEDCQLYSKKWALWALRDLYIYIYIYINLIVNVNVIVNVNQNVNVNVNVNVNIRTSPQSDGFVWIGGWPI